MDSTRSGIPKQAASGTNSEQLRTRVTRDLRPVGAALPKPGTRRTSSTSAELRICIHQTFNHECLKLIQNGSHLMKVQPTLAIGKSPEAPTHRGFGAPTSTEDVYLNSGVKTRLINSLVPGSEGVRKEVGGARAIRA